MTSRALAYDPAQRFAVTVEDVVYREEGGRSWLAQLHRPQGDGPFPALLELHGGAWNSGDRTSNPQLAAGLAQSGVLVASIDFRMGGEDPYPSSPQDINYAIRWLKLHAADFNADAERLGGLGISSGGHLIMLSAMRPHDPRYAALPLAGAEALDGTLAYFISCWGVLDPYGRYQMALAQGNAALAANHDRYFGTVETQQEASPLLILARGEPAMLPPALLIQGTADAGLPQGMVEDVARRYQAAGGAVDLALFPGMPHGIAGWPPEQVAQMIARMQAFIARHVAGPVAAG